MGLAKTGWKVVDGGPGVMQAIDEDERTGATFPQDIVIDMGKETKIRAFTYLPRQDRGTDGIADKYVFYTSADGIGWQKAAEGEFSNIRANPVEQVVGLDAPLNARYFKFSAVHVLGGNGVVVNELGVR
jgi:alpha-L-fucosidase